MLRMEGKVNSLFGVGESVVVERTNENVRAD